MNAGQILTMNEESIKKAMLELGYTYRAPNLDEGRERLLQFTVYRDISESEIVETNDLNEITITENAMRAAIIDKINLAKATTSGTENHIGYSVYFAARELHQALTENSLLEFRRWCGFRNALLGERANTIAWQTINKLSFTAAEAEQIMKENDEAYEEYKMEQKEKTDEMREDGSFK